jgi:hypothetical protein
MFPYSAKGGFKGKKNMKTIKLILLTLIAAGSFALGGCVSHTHERVVVEKEPVRDTMIEVHPR